MCGESFAISASNTISLDTPAPSNRPLHAISEGEMAFGGPRTCARCGRPFRGDWDRYQSAKGLICHVCANLTGAPPGPAPTEAPVEPPPTPLVAPPSYRAILEEHKPEEEEDDKELSFSDRFDAFKETRQFRVGLYLAAFSVIGIAIYYSVFHDFTPEPVPESATTGETVEHGRMGLALFGPPEELTKTEGTALAIIVISLKFVFALLPRFLAILLTLVFAKGMPGSTWWAGVIHITIVAVFTSLISCYIIMVGGILAVYVLYEIYDLRLGDIVIYVILNILLSLLMAPLAALVYGSVAHIFL